MILQKLRLRRNIMQIDLWWFCRGCSPLPIPNREVKPLMADGTAPQCGRVGSCHIHLKASSKDEAFLFISTPEYRPAPYLYRVIILPMKKQTILTLAALAITTLGLAQRVQQQQPGWTSL